MTKKYKLTDNTKIVCGVTLHQIQALRDIPTHGVKTGDMGGWIEKEDNLEHDGNAWVYGNASVYGNARVGGNAEVYGNASVYGNARVCGDAMVYKTSDYFCAGPIGSRDDYTTFFNTKKGEIEVKCGCFNGKIEEFLKRVEETHENNEHAQAYKILAEIAKLRIGGK